MLAMNFTPLAKLITAETPTVTVTAPAPFLLRLQDNTLIRVEAGVQEATEEVASHPYAIANGLTRYQRPFAAVTPPDAPVNDAPAAEAADVTASVKRGPGRPPKTVMATMPSEGV